ncbi:MAG: prepilin-type N-terminal cleavage/methylation domain-containing protein [Polyangiales bacterium]
MRTRRSNMGFTLIELMIVVVILGLLAALAVPSFTRYVRRSATTEASTNVQRIYAAQYTYNAEIHERGLSGSFVNAPATPAAAPTAAKYPADSNLWSSQPTWSALGFALDSRHYYQYSSPGSSTGFTSMAQGDLDGDRVRSTFYRTGTIVSGEIVGSALMIQSETE